MDKVAENLCVDLDGTLTSTDTIWELFARIIVKNPLYFFVIPFLLLKKRAFLKRKLSSKFGGFVNNIPFNEDVIKYIRERKSRGSKIWLVTACDKLLAEKIAEKVGLFDGVYASEGGLNLKGKNKAALLVLKFGKGNYDYIGNSNADIAVWRSSNLPIVVGSEAFAAYISRKLGVDKVLHICGRQNLSNVVLDAFRLMRVHQWLKNLLLFIPLIFGHRYFIFEDVLNSILAFFSFSFCASATYIINDIVDLESDRIHPNKKFRPLAFGSIAVSFGFLLMGLLAILSVALAAFLPIGYGFTLLLYVAVTLAYSFVLKKKPFFDVCILALLYLLRILAGGRAIDCPISKWLLVFSVFIFLGFALMKRYVEIKESLVTAKERGYKKENLKIVKICGELSCWLSLIVYVIYTQLGASMYYKNPSVLLLGVLPMGYFIWNMWRLASLGLVHSDPIVSSLKEKVNYLLLFIYAAIFLMANLC